MRTKVKLPVQDSNIDIFVKSSTLVFKFKNDVFHEITDSKRSELLLQCIDYARNEHTIKALFFTNEPECLNDRAYDSFLRRILSIDTIEHTTEVPVFAEKSTRYKEINLLNRLIKSIIHFHKLVVFGLQGEIVTPFVGISLSGDFRFVAPNTTFALSHTKYGLHPSGALPFFLTRYLHHSKAAELLLRGGTIDMEEAEGLGLISKIIQSSDFEEACLHEIARITSVYQSTLRNTKRLINFLRKDLEDYFEYEASILNL